MRKLAFAALLLLCACGPSAQTEKKEDADASEGVTLKAEEVKALGIAVASAQAAQYRNEIAGFGTVIALDTVAQSNAEFETASAAAAQSGAAAARAKSLGTGEEAAVSREVVEAAESKAAADQAALSLARRKADSAFGLHSPWQDSASRAAVMGRLASGKTVLVRVTFPLGALGGAVPQQISLTRLGNNSARWTANKVWEAPADPNLPGRGYYALVDGSDLAQNEHVIAGVATGAPQAGAVVPASALVLGEGEAWVYLQSEPGHYARARIETDKPFGNGYFESAGVTAGQKIVTSGAGLLYAHETNPSSGGGD